MRRGFRGLQRKLSGGYLRSPNYFAGSYGGAPISVLREYIETQPTPGLEDKDSGYGAPYIPVLKDGNIRCLDKERLYAGSYRRKPADIFKNAYVKGKDGKNTDGNMMAT